MLLNKISLFSNSRLNVKNIFAFKNLSSNVISSKAHFSHQPNVKSNIIDSGYKLTTLPSGFRVASETLKMSTATVFFFNFILLECVRGEIFEERL